ncbi:hypothetical protein U1839_19390 [Sphingomonas sp. RT2P30]|uniref:hypothetical protein n=1 Tax=Parasphingomonas halimpatiens TaxID=3096162 RepID=UPI002FC597E5
MRTSDWRQASRNVELALNDIPTAFALVEQARLRGSVEGRSFNLHAVRRWRGQHDLGAGQAGRLELAGDERSWLDISNVGRAA